MKFHHLQESDLGIPFRPFSLIASEVNLKKDVRRFGGVLTRKLINSSTWKLIKQECIPVGCVPTAAVATIRCQYVGIGQTHFPRCRPLPLDADPPPWIQTNLEVGPWQMLLKTLPSLAAGKYPKSLIRWTLYQRTLSREMYWNLWWALYWQHELHTVKQNSQHVQLMKKKILSGAARLFYKPNKLQKENCPRQLLSWVLQSGNFNSFLILRQLPELPENMKWINIDTLMRWF